MGKAKSSESEELRMLPHDDEAEKAILGTLFLNSSSWDSVSSIITHEDFYNSQNQIIFSVIEDYKDKNSDSSFDAKIILEELNKRKLLEKAGGASYLAELTNLQILIGNLVKYAEIVRDCSYRRLLFMVGQDLQMTTFDKSKDVLTSLEDGEKKINDVMLKRLKNTGEEYSIKKIVGETFDSINALIENSGYTDRVPTGFDLIDKYTNGGFAKGEYIIIAARPSIGKSAMALSIIYNMIRMKKRVAFFSLEMSSKTVAERLLAIQSKINLSKIIKAEFVNDEYNRLFDSVTSLYALEDNMFIVDVPNITLTELRIKARSMKKLHNLDCIFIDYIGLISLPGYTSSNSKRFEQVSAISLALKSLARELEIPLVVLCQVGRESEREEPILSNLRDSGSIEQDADIVCFLHRKKVLTEEEKQQNEKDSEGKANIQVTKFIIAKNRNGETGSFKIGYNSPYTQFVQVSQDATFFDYDPVGLIPKGKNASKEKTKDILDNEDQK